MCGEESTVTSSVDDDFRRIDLFSLSRDFGCTLDVKNVLLSNFTRQRPQVFLAETYEGEPELRTNPEKSEILRISNSNPTQSKYDNTYFISLE